MIFILSVLKIKVSFSEWYAFAQWNIKVVFFTNDFIIHHRLGPVIPLYNKKIKLLNVRTFLYEDRLRNVRIGGSKKENIENRFSRPTKATIDRFFFFFFRYFVEKEAIGA